MLDSLLADSLSLSTKIEMMDGHLFYRVARSSSAPTAAAQEAASAPSPAPKAAVVEAEIERQRAKRHKLVGSLKDIIAQQKELQKSM